MGGYCIGATHFFKSYFLINYKYLHMAKKAKKEAAAQESNKKNNYVVINEFDGVVTEAMAIRGIGVVVRERGLDGQMSSTFVPGVKIKTKKDWKYLIIDKGSKSKKSGEDESED